MVLICVAMPTDGNSDCPVNRGVEEMSEEKDFFLAMVSVFLMVGGTVALLVGAKLLGIALHLWK
jgi:hypothetical protein